jgi:uncharacterized protein with ParB-like and HNH nuclease domain
MALSLTAEQKDLLTILKREERYIIPEYQRPYSWEYEQCFQLYNDLMDAYTEKQEYYFLGNLVIAKSEAEDEKLEVIDGQQRLTTLLLLIKVLSVLEPKLQILLQILEKRDWTGNIDGFRIESEVIETEDRENLKEILDYDLSYFEKRFQECLDTKNNFSEKKCNNRFEANIMNFYRWLLEYKSKNSLEKFIQYLLKKVYLLPIELSGRTQDEANDKALIIFETINNRGMNLEDADIFKAKLYKKAEKVDDETKIFINLWSDLKNSCDELRIEIDDVFRYYSHIIRGEQGIIRSEINLRKFFINEPKSPFFVKKYREIMEDLFKIIEVLKLIEVEKNKESILAKYIQLIERYTNRYPKIVLVVYLFKTKGKIDDNFVQVFDALLRYIYYQGSISKIKFEIFSMIKNISSGHFRQISDYTVEDIDANYFNKLGSLKYGYALLSEYITREKAVANYSIDKIITTRDRLYLIEKLGWSSDEVDGAMDSLGNFILLDMVQKRMGYKNKMKYYSDSSLLEVKAISKEDFTYQKFKERDIMLKDRLVKFFKGEL